MMMTACHRVRVRRNLAFNPVPYLTLFSFFQFSRCSSALLMVITIPVDEEDQRCISLCNQLSDSRCFCCAVCRYVISQLSAPLNMNSSTMVSMQIDNCTIC